MDMSNYQISPAFSSGQTNAIVLAINNSYTQYCAATIQSLIEHSKPDVYYDVIVFEKDVTDRNKKLLNSIVPDNFSLRFFNVSSVIYEFLGNTNLKTIGYVSVESYYRLLIPIVMRKYERVLYLDSDICINSSIHELFEKDIAPNQIAGVLDTISQALPSYPKIYRHFREALKLKNPEKYFNTGLVLFDIGSINEDEYLNNVLTALKIKKLIFNDQDVFNVVFQDKIFWYPSKFNTQIGALVLLDKVSNEDYRKDYLSALNNPIVLHYTGERKPWDDPQGELSEVFWRYERKTPFYEECLLSSVHRNYVTQTQLKNLNSRFGIYFRYWFYKLLTQFSSGESKKEFEKRLAKYWEKVLDIRKYSNYK